jgi:hypothetical protein
MLNSYHFMSNQEPTKEQLDELMFLVSEEVKKRASKAEKKYKMVQEKAFTEAKKIWEQKQNNNDLK